MKTGLYWDAVRQLEKTLIPTVIARHNGILLAASKELGLGRSTLRKIMRENGIYEVPEVRHNLYRTKKTVPTVKPVKKKAIQIKAVTPPKAVLIHTRREIERRMEQRMLERELRDFA